MKTDRELLEAAARAAGLHVKWEPVHAAFWIEPGQGLKIAIWNPLHDDGDSFRLAVALHMGVRINGPTHWQAPNCTIILFGECSRLTWPHEHGAAEDTRRAIVVAAATMAPKESS